MRGRERSGCIVTNDHTSSSHFSRKFAENGVMLVSRWLVVIFTDRFKRLPDMPFIKQRTQSAYICQVLTDQLIHETPFPDLILGIPDHQTMELRRDAAICSLRYGLTC